MMIREIKASIEAQDRRAGVTLGELSSFVQACMRLDIEPTATIKITVGWSSQIQKMTATGTREAA